MIEILKYMKSEIAFLKRKQEALEFANYPRLRKIPRLLDLSERYINDSVRVQKNLVRKYIPTKILQTKITGLKMTY